MKPTAQEKERLLARFGQMCREQGLPFTLQRRTILEFLVHRSDHPTADEIYEGVKERLPGVSRTTVYRVLETITRMGLAHKVSHPGAAVRFDPVAAPHHHLVCRVCDRVCDLEDSKGENFSVPLPRRKDFEIDGYSIYFQGVCADCRKKQQRRSA